MPWRLFQEELVRLLAVCTESLGPSEAIEYPITSFATRFCFLFKLALCLATKLHARTPVDHQHTYSRWQAGGRLAMAPFPRAAGEVVSESLGPSKVIEYPIT